MTFISRLFATDHHACVLREVEARRLSTRYMPFGFSPLSGASVRFNGHLKEFVHGHYLLGNGYRVFNDALMRFHSPDRLSPFGAGGLNAYAYCQGDPVNGIDPSGHLTVLKGLKRLGKRAEGGRLRITRSSTRTLPPIGPRDAPLYAAHQPRLIGYDGAPISSAEDLNTFYTSAIIKANDLVSTEMWPTALAATRSELKTMGVLDTSLRQALDRVADFADELIAARRTPLLRLIHIDRTAAGERRAWASMLLERIFSDRYRSHLVGDRSALIRGIKDTLREGDYPVSWFRMT